MKNKYVSLLPGYCLDVSLILVHGELLYDGVNDVLDPGPLVLLPAVPALPVGPFVVLVHSLEPAHVIVTMSHYMDVELIRIRHWTVLNEEDSSFEDKANEQDPLFCLYEDNN